MKTIAQVSNVAILKTKQKTVNPETDKKPLNQSCCELVDMIFSKFYILCRGFNKFYEDRKRMNAEKTEWILCFQRIGFTEERDIIHGINKLCFLDQPNPPQLGEFLKWCKPDFEELRSIHGITDLESAYKESCRFSHPCIKKSWSHKFIEYVANETGLHFLSTATREKSFKLFKYNYLLAAENFMDGSLQFSSIPKALVHEDEKVIDKEKSDIAHKKCMKLVWSIKSKENKSHSTLV